MTVVFSWSIAGGASTPVVFTDAEGSEVGENALRDWRLDDVDGDLELTADGDALFITGVEGIVSDFASRVRTFLGEWFLDTGMGFPWFQNHLGQKANVAQFRRDIESTAAETPGITSVEQFTAVVDGRTMTAGFKLATDLGLMVEVSLANISG